MSSRWRSASTSDRRRTIAALAALVLPLGLCLAAVAGAGCGGASAPAAAGTGVAQPKTVDTRPAFDHKAHLGRGPTCVDCHPGAESKDEAGMPTLETCMDCHEEMEEKAPPEKKVAQFFDPKTKAPKWSRVTSLGDELVFSHEPHTAKKVPCADCHRGIEESTRVTADLAMNDMDACMACHAEKKAPNECATCHTRIGLETPPPNHDRLWTARHGQLVRRGAPRSRAEDCTLCHQESSCLRCHAEEPPRDHTQNWRVGPGHGLAAALDRERCQACHTSDACTECHTSNPPRSHRGGWGSPRNRHCLGCHEGSLGSASGGCSTCHAGAPSHLDAPRKPRDHRPDSQCLLCHDDLKHPVNSQNCNVCHR